MKKKVAIYIFIACCILGGSYKVVSLKTLQKKIIKSTWQQLSHNEKLEVKDRDKDGAIEKIKVPGDTGEFYMDESFNRDKVYLVKFKSQNADLVGDIEKLVDIESGDIVGYSLRD